MVQDLSQISFEFGLSIRMSQPRPGIPSLIRHCEYCGKGFMHVRGKVCKDCEKDMKENPEKYVSYSL